MFEEELDNVSELPKRERRNARDESKNSESPSYSTLKRASDEYNKSKNVLNRVNKEGNTVRINRKISAQTDQTYERIIEMQSQICSLWNTNPQFVLTDDQKKVEQSYIRDHIYNSGLTVSYLLNRAKADNIAVAFRPTATVSQNQISSEYPVKPVEIKNKTAKIEDYFIIKSTVPNREIEKDDILGFVLHYNPELPLNLSDDKLHEYSHHLASKIYYDMAKEISIYNIEVIAQHEYMVHEYMVHEYMVNEKKTGISFIHDSDQLPLVTLTSIQETILKRINEFKNYDQVYINDQSGLIKIEDCFVKLNINKEYKKIVGDHDLFCFAEINDSNQVIPYQCEDRVLLNCLITDTNVLAQHGGIYYWQTTKPNEDKIKADIMNAHGFKTNEPLIVITANDVKVCFFKPAQNDLDSDELVSVWDERTQKNQQWMLKTEEGREYFQKLTKPKQPLLPFSTNAISPPITPCSSNDITS
ncbi:hypothetical protein L3V83_08130 [Thiotrichales bacterium 19X7-9]|nr:hypothetical protein [Thiotrichales bacterium 19X7-9]